MTRLLGWLLLATSTPVFADGGTVLMRTQSPPFIVTVFASPTPPRVGDTDLSVLVQSSETLEPVLDADVRFAFVSSRSQIQVRATRSQARNKLLYAASVQLNDPGKWHYSVSIGTVDSTSRPVTVSGAVAVAPARPKLVAYWGYLMLPFLSLTILALHQRLRFRRPSFRGRVSDFQRH